MVTFKLRRNHFIRKLFLSYVGSLPLAYCNVRWNEAFYLLVYFVNNFSVYMKFVSNFSTFVDTYKFECSQYDYEIAKTIHKTLIPFEEMTTILFEDLYLSIY